jgi:hypothetical protein
MKIMIAISSKVSIVATHKAETTSHPRDQTFMRKETPTAIVVRVTILDIFISRCGKHPSWKFGLARFVSLIGFRKMRLDNTTNPG